MLLACIVSFEQSLCHVASSSAVSLPNKKTSHVKFRIHFKMCAITFRTLKENQPTYNIWLIYLFGRNAQNIYSPLIRIDLLFLV